MSRPKKLVKSNKSTSLIVFFFKYVPLNSKPTWFIWHFDDFFCPDVFDFSGLTLNTITYVDFSTYFTEKINHNLMFSFFFQYFSDIAQNPETNQRPPASFVHSSGYLPAAATTNPTTSSSGLYNSNSRETSPYSEFVNNGPTRIAMPYRVPDPVMPPWVTSTASVTSSTEHVYAVPARVIRSSEESVVSFIKEKSTKTREIKIKKISPIFFFQFLGPCWSTWPPIGW